MPEIALHDVSVTYLGKKKTTYVGLDHVSLSFPSDKTSVIVGYSGSGKSTLLKAVACLLEFDGAITADDKDVEQMTPEERNFSYLSQEYALYPHLTVFDNLAFPLKVERCSYEEITSRVKEMASTLGISHCLSRKPRQLSGGQQQRVALGRALIKGPSLLLLDEPFSNVDPQLKMELMQDMKETLAQFRTTVLYVTHSWKEATYFGDEIYVLNQGKLEIKGTPLELDASQNEVVRSLWEEKEG